MSQKSRSVVVGLLAALFALVLPGCPPEFGLAHGSATLRVDNVSPYDIYYLYVSPSSSTQWGSDQLGLDVLGSGESVSVTDLPCDQPYDIRMDDASHRVLVQRFGDYLACGEVFTLTVE